MHVTLVHVHVREERVGDFIDATLKNHFGSVAEPGNVRFDVLRSRDDPTRFVLYEVYRTPEDAAAHKKTAHYQTWRDTVADWMAEPRKGVGYDALAPADAEW
jgi:autoinducer 2-degrading protein